MTPSPVLGFLAVFPWHPSRSPLPQFSILTLRSYFLNFDCLSMILNVQLSPAWLNSLFDWVDPTLV